MGRYETGNINLRRGHRMQIRLRWTYSLLHLLHFITLTQNDFFYKKKKKRNLTRLNFKILIKNK